MLTCDVRKGTNVTNNNGDVSPPSNCETRTIHLSFVSIVILNQS